MKKRDFLIAVVLSVMWSVTAFAAAPLTTDRVNREGLELIIKTYEIAPDTDPRTLIESDFSDNRFTFTYLETKTAEVKSQYSKEIRFSRESETNGGTAAAGAFEAYIDYDDNGLTGRVYLDTGSLTTRVKGYTQQSYTVSATREYGGFTYTDPSSIPRSVEKDGISLNIQGISWVTTGTELVGDSLLPNNYKAVVSYSAAATKSVPTGYITTAEYSGTIEKTVVDKLIVTVIYAGTPILTDYSWLWIIAATIGGLILLGGGIIFLIFFKRDVEIYNKRGDDYERIGRDFIDFKNPRINLLPHNRNAYTADYALILSKKAARTLLGKEISVRFENKTINRTVENDKIYIREDEK